MSKFQILSVLVLALLIWGAVEVNNRLQQRLDNPAVERIDSQRTLEAYGKALLTYRQSYEQWPEDIRQLWDMKVFTEVSGLRIDKFKRVIAGHRVPGGGYYYYNPPPWGDTSELIMASGVAHRAVVAGEPFGAEGDLAPYDIPAAYYGLTQMFQVVELSAEEHAKRAAWVKQQE